MRLIYAEDCKDLMYVMCAEQDKAFVRAMEQVIDDCPTADAVPVEQAKAQMVDLVKSLEVVLGCLGVSVLTRETERMEFAQMDEEE